MHPMVYKLSPDETLGQSCGATGQRTFLVLGGQGCARTPRLQVGRIEPRNLRHACNRNAAPCGPKESKIALPVKISLPS